MMYVLYISLVIVLSIHAVDEIMVHNHTDRVLHAAVYYRTWGGSAYRWGDLVELPAQTTKSMLRPDRHYYFIGLYDRVLYFSEAADVLQEHMQNPPKLMQPIGALQGTHFYIAQEFEKLVCCNQLRWNIRTIHKAVATAVDFLLDEVRQHYGRHPYANEQAQVRIGHELCEAERRYVSERIEHARRAYEQLLHKPLEKSNMPRIAICCSGGGYRAMVAVAGWLSGARQAGLFDMTTYLGAISGGAWGIVGWVQSALPLEEYMQELAHQMETSFIYGHDNKGVEQALLRQIAFTSKLSLIDFYGVLLAQKLLCMGSCATPLHLSVLDHASCWKPEELPFPLYNAVIAQEGKPYQWVEFTPYEVGSVFLNAFIPLWAFGRAFFEGTSADFDPPQSLSFCMGLWGSALSANIKDVIRLYQKRIESVFIARMLVELLGKSPLAQERIYPAQVCNWTYGMSLPMGQQEQLTLVDAGLAINVPLPSFLRPERKTDIIIVLDASEPLSEGTELRKAQKYAHRHGLPFPSLDEKLLNESCSVHAQWDDLSVPVVIYMPLVKLASYHDGWDPLQQSFTSTFNFRYTREQVHMLFGLTEHAMQRNMNIIMDTIRRWIGCKQKENVCGSFSAQSR